MAEKANTAAAQTEVLGAATGKSAGAGLEAGSRIGDYRIRRMLGEGGMGQVYLAEQLQPVQRDVALKLLPKHVASPLARAYFEVERQALAQMQHPAIAQVFDAGTTTDGQAWIAMEYVEGQPITTWCRLQGLGLPERLRLFQLVCLGVQHAHQKGVIHRDLKPDNVLVKRFDGTGQPKIIDFGIAVGSDPGAGGERERAGTVTYMSPEQAAGEPRDIDTRSDVYSLGVMLFEVLTGVDASDLTTRPFQSGADLRTTLLHADTGSADHAESHSVLLKAARRLPVELRAVLRKALEPVRDQRYESAAALAGDLGRYLNRRPLMAMPQSRLYQARKFVSRHRFGIAATVLVAAALIGGLVLAMAGQHRAEVAALKARTEAAKAEKVSGFISDVLMGIDPDFAKGRDTTLMRMVLDRAADKAGGELTGEPEVRSSIEHIIAGSYASLGMYDKAAAHEADALKAARKAGLPPVRQAQLQLAHGLDLANGGASPPVYLKDVDEARALIAGVPENDLDRLSVEHDIATLEWQAGKLEPALERMKSVLARKRKLLAPDSRSLAQSESMLALLYSDMGDYAGAEPLFKELLERDRRQHGEENSNTIEDANELAINYMRQKHFAEGERLLRHYLPIAQKLFGPDHPAAMRLYSNLGGAIRQQDRNEEARPYYQKMLDWSLKTYGPDGIQSVYAYANLGFLLRDTGQLAAAEQSARKAIAHMDAALGKTNGARGQLVDLLGSILTQEKKYAQAATTLDRAWNIFVKSSGYGPDHPLAQQTVQHQIDLYRAWGKPDKLKLWQSRLKKSRNSTDHG